MPGLFRNALESIDADLKDINQILSECMGELIDGMKKLVEERK